MVEFFSSNTDSLRQFVYLLALHLPRCMIFIFFFPLFGKGLGQGGFLKVAVCGALLLAPVSTMVSSFDRPPIVPSLSVITAISEVIIGSLLGLTMAIPYYIFKAYGALIDVYRGATFAAQATGTDTGGEELPLENLFGLIFGAMVLAGPGLYAITSHLLDSYLILPPGSLEIMAFRPWAITLVQLVGDYIVLAFILSGPILVIILLVEVIMQIVSAFTPQMQLYSLQFGFRSVAAIAALLLFLNFAESEIFTLLGDQSKTLTNLLGGFE
jgi:type III secretory pathway component EscT